jgi:hypothetical protein
MSTVGFSSSFATSLSQMQSGASRATFNLQFNIIQNTAIKRLNQEVQGVLTDRQGDRKRTEIANNIEKFQKQQVRASQYLQELETNTLRLQEVQGKVAGLILGFSLGNGNSSDVSAKEAKVFNSGRDELVSELEKLTEQSMPNTFDGDIVTRIHGIAAKLKPLVAKEGVLEGEDVSPQTNDNGTIDRLLDDLSRQVLTALRVSEVTKGIGHNMFEYARSKLNTLQADQIKYNDLEAARRQEQIDEIKGRYANMLRAIELSFETQNAASERLANGLNINRELPLGSVLNMFA